MARARRSFRLRRVVTLGVLVVAVASSSAHAAGGARTAQSWAAQQIAAVVAAGAMGPDAASFRASDPITGRELDAALTALGRSTNAPPDPLRPVTVRELDARIVTALGLRPAARRIRLSALAAGLEPTSMLGTETVARLLGLRVNHPQIDEQLELASGQPATRAEAAYSLARMTQLATYDLERVDELSLGFSVPALDRWQRPLLTRALRLVGSPYVWAGSSERPQRLWSATAPGGSIEVPGGFDCSGLVWRVFKLEPVDGAPGLADALQGRTSYAMAGEVPKSERIPRAALQPADIVFFGSRGPESKPAEVDHMGIYLGNGWFVHSSTRGVTLEPLVGWYESRFAWGRRPLAEAGLSR